MRTSVACFAGWEYFYALPRLGYASPGANTLSPAIAGLLINGFQLSYSQEILSPPATQAASHRIFHPRLRACHRSFWLSLGLRKARLPLRRPRERDRKSTRLNSSHSQISYAVFCLKKKKKTAA